MTVRADDGRPLLDRVDLRVPGGTLLAVVGASGAGKSLLAAVAGRLRDPDDGEVLLDGVPLPELTPAALHAAVGYGFERPVLVGETVGAAVGVGARPGAAGQGRRHPRLRRTAARPVRHPVGRGRHVRR